MNNENVKIKIDERDLTSGASGGTNSTDIAFIPGFSVKTDASKIPTLCTTLKEFKEAFGAEPAKLKPSEVVDVTTIGFKEGDPDRSYIYATELLAQGMSVVYCSLANGATFDLDAFYDIVDENNKPKTTAFELILTNYISDKSLYDVKYITSGGYPSSIRVSDTVLVQDIFGKAMLNCAAERGDAVALLDYVLNDKDEPMKLYAAAQSAAQSAATVSNIKFGAAMYPWASYDCPNAECSDITMPASFGYLMCVAKAIKTSPNWLAMAGVARGIIPGINYLCVPNGMLSNKIAEDMQPRLGTDNEKISVNCITDIRPYGLTLWGNRTLLPLETGKGTTALCALNTRNMLSDIKKLLYTTAKSLMFEQNTDALWLRFKSGVSPLLNQLKSGNGISDYKLIKNTTRYNGDPLTRGEISATIKIYPIHAVEYFELTVEISDEDVTVS